MERVCISPLISFEALGSQFRCLKSLGLIGINNCTAISIEQDAIRLPTPISHLLSFLLFQYKVTTTCWDQILVLWRYWMLVNKETMKQITGKFVWETNIFVWILIWSFIYTCKSHIISFWLFLLVWLFWFDYLLENKYF